MGLCFKNNLEKLKTLRRAKRGRLLGGGLEIISVPTFTFNKRDVMPLHHGFVTLERDTRVNCPSKTPER